jgi:hypothetical protein
MLIEEINKKFNEELFKQIDGLLPKYHTYQLGMPAEVLQSVQIPDLPIELRASRLSDKAMQKEHPFDLREIMDLPIAVQNPLAIFRSVTHLESYVIMTELEHDGRNYIIALEINKSFEKMKINSIRSIHYRKSNFHIINWINEGLMEYVDKKRMTKWLSKQRYNSADVKKPFSHNLYNSKQQYNSAEVRKLFNHAAKIVQNFENAKI